MSLARRAAGGAAVTIGLSLLARAAGLVGTVIITHRVAPSVMGEVAGATVLAFTAGWLSAWGFNQYVIVRGHQGRDSVFHVSVLHLAAGTIALSSLVLVGGHFTRMLNAPHLMEYLPGMALSVWIRRLASIPDKLLMRELRFRVVALANVAGELVYVTLAVSLIVTTDLGGRAIVLANIVQAIVVASTEIIAEGWRSWLTPARLQWRKIREILLFGMPLAIETVLSEAGRYWDKLVFARQFGTHSMGMYSLAYNLSDMPATYVGEHVAGVLFPTLARINPAHRDEFFCRSFGLLCLVVLPMAVGLASVSDTLVAALLPLEWQGVSDYLVVLGLVAVFRPVNAVIASLLMASERNRLLLAFESLKVALLLGGMWLLARFGERAAVSAVGIAMGVQAIGLLLALSRKGFPASLLIAQTAGPVIAAALLALGVLAAREAFRFWPAAPLALQLAAEIAAGAVVYAGSAWIFARPAASRLLEIARDQLRNRGSASASRLAG